MGEKYYYSIREVSKIVGVKPHVLRYWEQEFRELHPKRTDGGRRVYTPEDIETILFIKELLYKDKYSIEGAKRRLKYIKRGKKSPDNISHELLNELESGLKELRKILSS